MSEQSAENDYVECAECGHPLERHIDGCDVTGCACPAWTRAEIEQARRRDGLPARWKAGTI